MFKQQRKAAGYFARDQLSLFKLRLKELGYEAHDGPKVQRASEILALRATFNGRDGLRQNHVQVVDRGGGVLAVYAHTEPHTDRLVAHAIAAVGDDASFSGGSKMLRNDLDVAGFRLKPFADVRARRRR